MKARVVLDVSDKTCRLLSFLYAEVTHGHQINNIIPCQLLVKTNLA